MKKYLIIGVLSLTLMATTVYALSDNTQDNNTTEQTRYNENCPYHNEDCPYNNEECPYYNSSNHQNCPYYEEDGNCTNCVNNTNNHHNNRKNNYRHHNEYHHN